MIVMNDGLPCRWLDLPTLLLFKRSPQMLGGQRLFLLRR